MKKLLLFLGLLSFVFVSCKDDVSKEIDSTPSSNNFSKSTLKDSASTGTNSQVQKGEIIFSNSPFDYTFKIETEEGNMVVLTQAGVIAYLNGEMSENEDVLELENFRLIENPNNSKEHALIANTNNEEVNTQVTARLIPNGTDGYILSGKCECTSTCSSGCSARNWGVECSCSKCSDGSTCNKKSTIDIPSLTRIRPIWIL